MAEDSEFIFKWNTHLSDIASKMHCMLERETLVDATLISAEGKSMKVHRLMLCASSKLFEVNLNIYIIIIEELIERFIVIFLAGYF